MEVGVMGGDALARYNRSITVETERALARERTGEIFGRGHPPGYQLPPPQAQHAWPACFPAAFAKEENVFPTRPGSELHAGPYPPFTHGSPYFMSVLYVWQDDPPADLHAASSAMPSLVSRREL